MLKEGGITLEAKPKSNLMLDVHEDRAAARAGHREDPPACNR